MTKYSLNKYIVIRENNNDTEEVFRFDSKKKMLSFLEGQEQPSEDYEIFEMAKEYFFRRVTIKLKEK